jgi:hypothetical protein
MRYFFHAVGTKCAYKDENGEEFGNDDDAIEYGATIAKELSDDSTLNMTCILVVDEEEREIFCSPITKNPPFH